MVYSGKKLKPQQVPFIIPRYSVSIHTGLGKLDTKESVALDYQLVGELSCIQHFI
jgi:hypothetical protein